jgi:hypothetical protein
LRRFAKGSDGLPGKRLPEICDAHSACLNWKRGARFLTASIRQAAMAHQWFIQHGGKIVGPATSGQLKKLAADKKIAPTTQVRLGESGAWVPASRVQGLFDAQPAASPAQAPRRSDPLAPPALAPPVPPPPRAAPPLVASPLARVPLGAATVTAAPVEETSIVAKIVGAVALILGTLAMSTFWLPLLGPMGWTGIVVGGLGLLLAIGGLVLAAMHKGSGLYLNVAAASSSLVGLVLTVVLGIQFGMFSSPAPAPAPVTIPTPPVAAAPAPPVELPAQPEPEPEPAPPPEPVWTDAGQSIEQGPIKATITGVAIENVRLESADFARARPGKAQPMLRIRITIENISQDKIVQVPGWSGGIGGGLDGGLNEQIGGLLKGSELGKAVETAAGATATAKLSDNAGNNYPQTPALRIFGNTSLSDNPELRPAVRVQKEVVFSPPLDQIEFLRLELPAVGFSGTDALRFQIPRGMVAGLPSDPAAPTQ